MLSERLLACVVFSHGDGNPDPGYAGERHGTPSEVGLQLPLGWQWAGPWTTSIGNPNFDKEGMQYAFNWGRDAKDYAKKNGFSDCVRRRQLVRQAVKLKPRPGPGDAVAAPPPGYAQQGNLSKVRNDDFPLKNNDFPLKNVDLLLKNVDL